MTESGSSVRKRLPTILAEALSVIFAVLVALAVDEWWEEQENVALAERMTGAIAQEIRGNREELRAPEGGQDPAEMLEAIQTAIAAYRAGNEPDEVGVHWDVALLSSAAWDAAQVSRATQYMELDRLVDLAQVYEFQRFYGESQDRLTSLILEIPAGMERAPVETLLALRSRFAVTMNLRSTLSTVYACKLADLEGPDAPGAEECPRDAESDAGAPEDPPAPGP